MRAVVLYESMSGNTRQIAEAIAEGLQSRCETVLCHVAEAGPDVIASASLLVAGGPTHAWSLSRPATRRGAADQIAKLHGAHLESAATGPGLREWLVQTAAVPADVATFATRLDAPRAFTGNAARRLAHALTKRGGRLVEPPASFLVTKGTPRLLPGELERARAWGAHLAVSTVAHDVGA